MKNIWSVIFTRAIVDGSTNSLILLDCVEEVTVNFVNAEDINKSKKNIPINFAIVSLWGDKDISKNRKFDHLIELIDPQGKKINEFLNTPIFEEGKKRLRTIVQMDGMGITSEGEYIIVVKYKMDSDKFIIASRIPVDIKFVLNTPLPKIKSE
ncbi:MAG: hypothetical protein WC349_04875 [Patescibacteria group bacterium]|jgi:hypothetical protein